MKAKSSADAQTVLSKIMDDAVLLPDLPVMHKINRRQFCAKQS